VFFFFFLTEKEGSRSFYQYQKKIIQFLDYVETLYFFVVPTQR